MKTPTYRKATKVEVKPSSFMGGRCLVATERIEKGEVVGEYHGRLIPDMGESAVCAMIGYTTFYAWKDDMLIDPEDSVFGCLLGYGNSSHQPSTEFQSDNEFGIPSLVAVKTIMKGQQITYEYGLDIPPTPYLRKKWRCLCGTKNCTGDLLLHSEDSPADWARDYKMLVARAEYWTHFVCTHGPRSEVQSRLFKLLKADDLQWLSTKLRARVKAVNVE